MIKFSYRVSALELATTEQPLSESVRVKVRSSTYLCTGVVWVPVTDIPSLPVSLYRHI